MKKIPNLFLRNHETGKVTDEINPECEWVVRGEGFATLKYDGTACMVQDGKLFKRYDCKRFNSPPSNFIPCQDPDEITGHWPGWVPVDFSLPENRYHKEAWENNNSHRCENGTYELCGPKINKNRERCQTHMLFKHGSIILNEHDFFKNKTFECALEILKGIIITNGSEGVVFYHPDGRMCKYKV